MAPQTSQVVIGMVARAEEMQTFLRECLTALGAQVRPFPALQAVKEVLHTELFSGFVVDLRTLVGASAAEKALAHALEQAFPFMRVIGNLPAGRFTGHIRGESLLGEAACVAFLERYCRPFGLKQFRVEQRKQLHLSVSWSRVDGPRAAAPILATTMNVSRHGMFIIDPTAAVDVGTRVYVHLSPARHTGPLLGVVRWCLPWGQSTQHPPGFGMELIELSEAQQEAFDQVAGWSRSAIPEDEDTSAHSSAQPELTRHYSLDHVPPAGGVFDQSNVMTVSPNGERRIT
jgi:PilZ domain